MRCLQMVSVKREERKGGRKRKREGKIHHLGKDRLKRSGFLTISMPVLFFPEPFSHRKKTSLLSVMLCMQNRCEMVVCTETAIPVVN